VPRGVALPSLDRATGTAPRPKDESGFRRVSKDIPEAGDPIARRSCHPALDVIECRVIVLAANRPNEAASQRTSRLVTLS